MRTESPDTRSGSLRLPSAITRSSEAVTDTIGPENGDRCLRRGGSACYTVPRNLQSANRLWAGPDVDGTTTSACAVCVARAASPECLSH